MQSTTSLLRRLVHRDFKPANIMFADAQGNAVIGDFGIVRDLRKDSLTQTYLSSGPGTPFFAAARATEQRQSLNRLAHRSVRSWDHLGHIAFRLPPIPKGRRE